MTKKTLAKIGKDTVRDIIELRQQGLIQRDIAHRMNAKHSDLKLVQSDVSNILRKNGMGVFNKRRKKDKHKTVIIKQITKPMKLDFNINNADLLKDVFISDLSTETKMAICKAVLLRG